jgi:beta-fructofuranosidase
MHLSRRSFLVSLAGATAASASSRDSLAFRFPDSSQKLADDILRPQYHLLPAANWMNDPNGPIYWNGQYHVFHQYNPNGAYWGDMHWAHSMSPDMVHWKHLPIALAPTPGGPDQDGCFSGSAVVDRGVATIVYTGVATSRPEQATLNDGQHTFRETQCLATTDDPQLRTWQKLPKPVLDSPPAGLAVTGFRDPCVWKEGETWYMAIGSGFPKNGGAILLYRSSDLRRWEYLHPLYSGKWNGKATADLVDSGEMWECPDFFPLGNKHVLFYSTERKVYWTVGEYDRKEQKYHPQKQGLLDSGSYYAPKSMLDEQGNRILWGWVPETRPVAEYKAAGWAGLMALPRVLTVADSGELEMRVIPRLNSLRKALGSKDGLAFANFSAELSAQFSWQKAFALQFGPQAKPYLDLSYEPAQKRVEVNGQVLTLGAGGDETAELNVFMDGSVIEILIGNRQAHTLRVYTLDKTQPNTSVRVSGELKDVKLWPIEPISNNRLTG